MILAGNLKKNNIIIKAKAKNRWELIDEMLNLAVKNRNIPAADSEEIRNALVDREKSMSTGIGNGVAIPHCTTGLVENLVVVLSLCQKGIDFDSIDSKPVRIAILLIVPKKNLKQHIKTLANIAKIMSDEDLRNAILEQTTPEAVLKTIKNADSSR